MRLAIVNNPLQFSSTLCRADSTSFFVSARKPSDPLFQFSPNIRVWTVAVPKLMTRPAPVSHQIKVVEFLAEMAVSLGRVVAIKRSLL